MRINFHDTTFLIDLVLSDPLRAVITLGVFLVITAVTAFIYACIWRRRK